MDVPVDRCLRCGGTLDRGYLESGRPINWVMAPGRILFTMWRGERVSQGFWKGSTIPAARCNACDIGYFRSPREG
ncbi:MAG: hypothetical protein QOG16_813 [Actinomycetota bacterium]|nr:hypothetical protein [Actinomycetota bacterium]